jgi:hypothetical protein
MPTISSIEIETGVHDVLAQSGMAELWPRRLWSRGYGGIALRFEERIGHGGRTEARAGARPDGGSASSLLSR